MRVVLSGEARVELREAMVEYRKVSKALARRFRQEIDLAKALIAESPARWAEVEPGVRRVLLHKFPYALLHAVEERQVVVLVVKHHKRHPDYWKSHRR